MHLSILCIVAAVVHGSRVVRQEANAAEETFRVEEACSASMKPIIAEMDVPALFGAAEGMGKKLGRGFIMKPLLYRLKWNVARNMSALPGQDITWDSFINSAVYAEERRRLKALGKMAVKEDNSTELTASGICDLGHLTMKKIARSYAWQGFRTPACQGLASMDMQRQVELALEDLCFSSCAAAMQPLAEKCDGTGFTQAAIDELLASNEQCLRLSYDSLWGLGSYLLERRCKRFPPKSLLWETDDKNAGDYSQQGDNAVCQVGVGKNMLGQSKEVAEQVGVCPEGTNCKCPRPSLFERSTTTQYRKVKRTILAPGSFSAASLMRQGADGFLLVGTGGVTALIAAGIFVPPIGIGAAGAAVGAGFSVALNNAMWQCQDTLGCWPNYADQVVSQDPKYEFELRQDLHGYVKPRPNCRMPEKAKKGGSKMWFMPPPGLAMKMQAGTCKLVSCKEEDFTAEKIGFRRAEKNYDKVQAANPHVYNCQPLNFEDMTPSQQQLFVRIVRQTDKFREYRSEYPEISIESTTTTTTTTHASSANAGNYGDALHEH